MERRDFIKVSLGFAAAAAGAAALAASAQAAPLLPQPLSEDGRQPPVNKDVRPALTTADEASHLKPEEVGWHRHWGWHRRHWGWRRRHWGWRRRWHRW
ncbi:MAG TPA: twin-arginine translocation (Tat) [Bradyrhizobium sp.]|nr:twin-arginine translocation (Tat) [Bradyrhizobium sp.]